MEQQDGVDKDSRFVTVLGWTFIGFFGYSVMSALVQGIVFYFKPPVEILETVYPGLDLRMFLPPVFFYILEHIHLFLAVSLTFSLPALAASAAFLKRRDWARVFMAVFFLVTIVISFAGMYFHDAFLVPTPADPGMRELTESMNRLLQVFLVVMILVITVLHGWVAYKLLSKNIKAQFQPGPR